MLPLCGIVLLGSTHNAKPGADFGALWQLSHSDGEQTVKI